MTAVSGARDHAREQQQRCQDGLDYAAANPAPSRSEDWVARVTRERDLWAQIADELDAYLADKGRPVQDVDLFGPPADTDERTPDA